MAHHVPTGRTRGVVKRIALGAMVVIGAFLIVFPLATNLPGKSSATGDMMTAFRPQMATTALAQGVTDGRSWRRWGSR